MKQERKQILSRLKRVHRWIHLIQVFQWLANLFTVSVFALLIFALLDLLVDFSPQVRMWLWLLPAGVWIWYLVGKVAPRLRCAFLPSHSELEKTARQVGELDATVKDAIVDYLQLSRLDEVATSPALLEKSLEQLSHRFRHLNFQEAVPWRKLHSPLLVMLAALLALGLPYLIWPTSYGQSLTHFLLPWRVEKTVLPIQLENVSGDRVVLKNDPLVLEGKYRGVVPEDLWLVMATRTDADSQRVKKIPLSPAANGSFVYQLPHVAESFEYWFEARLPGRKFRHLLARTAKAAVTVKERPLVQNLQIKLTYPAYSGLKPLLLDPNQGEITALRGTIAHLEIQTNKSLAAAYLLFSDSSSRPLRVQENRAAGTINITRDDTYEIHVLDRDSIPNYRPVRYSIFALNDELPFVQITLPGQDVDLGNELQIPLQIKLRDDYGFSRLLLKGQLIRQGSSGDTTAFQLQLPIRSVAAQHAYQEAISEVLWDLTSFYLVPEDYIEYYAEVWDNDRVSGPKSARSRTYVIRLPSLFTQMQQAEQQAAEQLEETRQAVEETRQLKEKLEEITRELRRETELNWERKQEIAQKLEQHQQVMEKLENVHKQLEALSQQLEEQDVLSPETLEKYFELQKMFSELATPELMEAMRKLQEAIEKADLEKVKQALNQFQQNLEQFEQSVERAYELFKQIQLEQRMDELVKLSQMLMEEQKRINQELDRSEISPEEQRHLAGQEEHLQQQAEFLEQKMDQAVEQLKEQLAEVARQVQQARDYLQEQQLRQQIGEMAQQLRQGNSQQAGRQGQKLERQMEMLHQMLQSAQQNMLQQQKEEIMQAMQKVTHDMLRASFRQERVIQQTRRTSVASPRLSDIAREQARLQENTRQLIRQLIDISKKTFYLSPQLNQILAQLVRSQQRALQNLEERNLSSARGAQKKAMASLNLAIMSLQQSMEQLAQGSSASGFEEFMKQLQQMAGQQGQLNQQTLSLFQQQGQGRMQLSEEAMARLAAQQEMIRRSLEQLNQQMGNRRDVLGRLGELGQEMEEVVRRLKQQQLDRELIERQERILSRLLDAQKSVREKEYSRKRQAERAEPFLVRSPEELNQQVLKKSDLLRKEMLRSLEEGYSPEFRDYIKLYYELLSRQKVRSPENQ